MPQPKLCNPPENPQGFVACRHSESPRSEPGALSCRVDQDALASRNFAFDTRMIPKQGGLMFDPKSPRFF